ncbi:MAG TPA: O-antigen polysaccharide polymerase Wzy [Longimicrobium sp.]
MTTLALAPVPAAPAAAPVRSGRLGRYAALRGFAYLWTLACLACGAVPDLRLLCSVLAAGGIAAAVVLHVRRSQLGLLAPFTVFMGSGLMYMAPMAFTLLVGGVLLQDREIRPYALTRAAWICGWAMLAAWTGYALVRSHAPPVKPFSRFFSTWQPTAAKLVAWGLIFMGGGLLLYLVVAVIGLGTLLQSTYGGRYVLLRGLGPLTSGLSMLTIGGVILYADDVRRGRTLLSVGMVVTLALLVLWTGILEMRGSLVQAAMAFLVVRHVSGRRVRTLTFAVIVVALMGGGIVLSLVRGGGSLARLREVPVAVYNPANNEFGSPLGTVSEIVEFIPSRVEYRLGSTYLMVAANMVPLVLWPGRPLAPSEWYSATFYPSYFESGGGFAFSPVAEAYLNFGYAGVVLVFLLIGGAVAVVERKFELYDALPPWVGVSYALVVPWLVIFFRLDMTSFVKSYLLLTLMPMLLVALVAKLLVRMGARGL